MQHPVISQSASSFKWLQLQRTINQGDSIQSPVSEEQECDEEKQIIIASTLKNTKQLIAQEQNQFSKTNQEKLPFKTVLMIGASIILLIVCLLLLTVTFISSIKQTKQQQQQKQQEVSPLFNFSAINQNIPVAPTSNIEDIENKQKVNSLNKDINPHSTIDQKLQKFKKIKIDEVEAKSNQMKQQKSVKLANPSVTAQILKDKDEEFSLYSLEFEKDFKKSSSEAPTSKDISDWENLVQNSKRQRKMIIQDQFKWVASYLGNKAILSGKQNITYDQFAEAVQLTQITGQDYTKDEKLKSLVLREKQYYENKYNVSQYEEIPMCIIVPSFKNEAMHRYYYNLQSLLMQDYTKYRVIIIDDMSPDNTTLFIKYYLYSKQIPSDKFILLQNTKRKLAMENIYYVAHKYCEMGQIMMIIDGDDELIGTQNYKLFNAIYHQQKANAVYSNHLWVKTDSVNLGISESYPPKIIKTNTYRSYPFHPYSHLRSSRSDLFLLLKQESFKTKENMWYPVFYDNAIYYSIFQLSCQKVYYIPEFNYRYNFETGLNDYRSVELEKRKAIGKDIRQQKNYKCIDSYSL